MIFPDFVSFPPEQCLNQFVCHICLDQVQYSFFFLKSTPEELYIPKINSLCEVLNADNTEFPFIKWYLLCFVSRLSIELKNQKKVNDFKQQNDLNLLSMVKPILPESFYLLFLDMKKVKSKESSLLLQIFTGESDFFQKNKSSNPKLQSSDDKKPVIQAISYLFEEHRGLYTALLRHGYLEALLLRIGPELLFNHFKFNSFSLKEQFDKSYLPYFNLKMVNSSNFTQFWSQYPLLSDSESSKVFQSLFACDSPFPCVSTKYFPEDELNDSILSLTNDVLTKRKKTFIDNILIVCRTFIINGLKVSKDQECFFKYTKSFPDLRILAFLSEYESIKNEAVFDNVVFQVTNNLDSEVDSISQIDPNSIMTDVMQRFGNDYSVCFFLASTIGRKTRTVDLEQMSIPKYLIVHGNLDIDCSNFNDKKMFVLNDKDRKNDLSFIYIYQALCLIINQIPNLKKNESQIDFSEISTTDSISDISMSSIDLTSTFTSKLVNLLEYIKSLTDEESFEKVVIELFSVIFITEKNCSLNEMNSFVFTDDQMAEIVSILFHFCPNQKEIRRAFLKFKFIKVLSQKKFDEAKNLAQTESDSFYKLALIAELISKILNSEQWSFPSCVDKSLFDAEYFLSNNDDFGADMSSICPELTILAGRRRTFKNKKRFMPYELYDVANTKRNLAFYNSMKYDQIERDPRCIQFNDFIDFELKLDKSGSKGLDNIDDIVSFEIKNDSVASLLTLKTVPEKYKGNKLIKAIFDKTANSNSNISEEVNLKDEIQSVEDVLNFLKNCDEKLSSIEASQIQTILTKCFTFSPLPYDILNDLFLRNEKVVSSFYNAIINRLKIGDFVQLMPFCYYRTFSKPLKFVNENMNLTEFLEFLVVNKKFMSAKQLAEDFNLTIQLDLLIKEKISIEDYQTIELTFPHLKGHIENLRRQTEINNEVPSETELYFIGRLSEFFEFDEDEIEDYPTFSKLFPLFQSIKKNLESISIPLMKHIVDVVTALLSCSSIDSLEAELSASSIFPRLLYFMKLFKLKMRSITESLNYQSFLYQLECLAKLVCCGFHATFREVYNFNNFFSKQQGASYASLCQKYDKVGILRDIQTCWCLTDYRFFDSVLSCIKLGLVKRGNIELRETYKTHQALKIDCQSFASDLIPLLSFVQPFAASNYIEKVAELDLCDVNFESIIQKDSGIEINRNLCEILKSFRPSTSEIERQLVKLPIVHITSPQIIQLDESLSIIGAADDRILFHCQFGDFEEAFNLFDQFYLKSGGISNNNIIITSSSRLSVFMRVLITPAIAFKQWNVFWRKFIRFLNVFEKVVDDFINFLSQNKMDFILFDVQRRLEYNDNALYAAIKLFSRVESWKKQQELLNTMNSLIQKSLKLSTKEEKARHKSFFTIESLLELQRRTNVQLAIVSMFINTKAPFDKNLELMTSKENTINLASYLLLRFQIGYFNEICELPGISMDEICDNAIELLNTKHREEGVIATFFKNLTKLDIETYRKLIMCLSKSIYRRVPDEESFLQFVRRNIKGEDLIVAVLQNFGFENEADEILQKKSHK